MMKAAHSGGAGRLPVVVLAVALPLWLPSCVQSDVLRELHLDLAPAERPAPSPAGVPDAAVATSSTSAPMADQRRPAPSASVEASKETPFSLAAIRQRLEKALAPSGPSIAQRQRLGDALAREVLAHAKTAQDPEMQRRLEGIVGRLAKVAAGDGRWPRRWKVHILRDERPDAFTSGAGHLFITTGMVGLLGTDERIATVLAHEMAHNLLGHVWAAKEKKDMARDAHRFSREVLARKMNLPWLGKSVSFVVNASLNTYSRQQEYDADGEGLDLLVRAGWKPQVALETFDYLRRRFREEAALKNFFYNNHPLYERRRWYIENRIRAHYRAQAGLPPVQRSNWKTRR